MTPKLTAETMTKPVTSVVPGRPERKCIGGDCPSFSRAEPQARGRCNELPAHWTARGRKASARVERSRAQQDQRGPDHDAGDAQPVSPEPQAAALELALATAEPSEPV